MHTIFPLPFILMLLFVLVVLSFFFSAAETSIIGLSKIKLRHMLAKGIKRAQNIQRLVVKIDKLIAAILIGNNVVNIAISAIVTVIFVDILGERVGIVVSTMVTAFFVLLLCEITPKILATKHTEKVALATAPIMEVLVRVFSPFITFFIGISNIILKIFGAGKIKKSPLFTQDELRLMIEIGREEGVLSDEEKKMLHRIFEFGNTQVGVVMVPKEKIVAVNMRFNLEQILDIIVEQGHARIPVYDGTIDNIVGIIYARDLLYVIRDKELFVLQDVIQEVCLTSATTRVNELLRKFQAEKIQLAVVVDENKKPVGLVTIEDLIEEIVGEIEEKHQRLPLSL